MGYTLNFDVVWKNLDRLFFGLALGLGLAVVAIAIGAVVGVLFAFASMSRQRLLRAVVSGYVTLIRNTRSW